MREQKASSAKKKFTTIQRVLEDLPEALEGAQNPANKYWQNNSCLILKLENTGRYATLGLLANGRVYVHFQIIEISCQDFFNVSNM